jgi:predicted nucleic acid-binding protein
MAALMQMLDRFDMLLDTSGLFCYLHQRELYHQDAVDFMRSAKSMLTHDYVIAEVIALAHSRRLPRNPTLSFIHDLLAHPDITVMWVSEPLRRSALDLLFAQPDKDYSLCDAISIRLMEEYRITDVLTTDHHFEQAGYRRLLVAV